VDLIDQALSKIHSLHVSDELRAEVTAIATSLHDFASTESETALTQERQIALFQKAWQPDQQVFINASGVPYFTVPNSNFTEHILSDVKAYEQSAGDRLILKDVNFGNVAFGENQAYLVDPPYLVIGKPDHDQTVLGINIVRQAT